MRYEAELFDCFQYLYDVTGFTDHQLHCMISFEDQVNTKLLEKAFQLLLKVIPILSSRYQYHGGTSYWESVDSKEYPNLFTIVHSDLEFQQFHTSKIDETRGPQIKACCYQTEKIKVAIVLNHMVCDGAGFKQCLYVLSDLYNKLLEKPGYVPDFVIDGDRSIRGILAQISTIDKLRALFLQNSESNTKSTLQFPCSTGKTIAPFIINRVIGEEQYHAIVQYGKTHHATVNDMLLTAYYRAMAKYLKLWSLEWNEKTPAPSDIGRGRSINIPIMVDMRKYLKDSSFTALTNLSSMVITGITLESGETFEQTLRKVNREMDKKKKNNIGLNALVKLSAVTKIFGKRIGYELIQRGLNNPLICMTNIGIIDSERLQFQGSKVSNLFICGSIKYRPYFQMALSTFQNAITLTCNLYGDDKDKERMKTLMSLFQKELPR